MNIQRLNLSNVSFNAKIGTYLQKDIEKKSNFIKENYLIHNAEVSLTQLTNSVEKIKKLFPEVFKSPVVVDIKIKKKTKIKNGQKIEKIIPYYYITNEAGTFKYWVKRESDDFLKYFKYDNLIASLEILSNKFFGW